MEIARVVKTDYLNSALRRYARNMGLVVGSLLISAALFELIARTVLQASDLPLLEIQDENNRVLHYSPNQAGTYRIRDEIEANYRINSQGWNSGWGEYQKEKGPHEIRICVIGDSYIEALQVDYDKSVAEKLEEYLQPLKASVYRFGLSGAALSHYLYVLRNEVLQYSPDIVIINLVHNDFLESIRAVTAGVYDTSLAKLRVEDGKIVGITNPQAYQRSPSWWVKRSALFRYFWVKRQVRPQALRQLWLALFDNGDQEAQYSGNIRVSTVYDPIVGRILDYIFSELKGIELQTGAEILLVLDANRSFIQRKGLEKGKVDSLAVLHSDIGKAAEQNGLDLIDLNLWFPHDYQENGIPFSFPHDGHWNQYAHSLVAQIVGGHIHKEYLPKLGKSE